VGIEPTSSAWKAEVLPLNYTRRCTASADLEPFRSRFHLDPVAGWRGKDSNLRRRKPADLQSAPVGRLGTPPRKRAAYSDFWVAGCQCILARKLLARAPLAGRLDGSSSLERERCRPGTGLYELPRCSRPSAWPGISSLSARAPAPDDLAACTARWTARCSLAEAA
jgi:hypothetical protein